MKRAHEERPAATAARRRMNEQLQEENCPDAVEPGGSHTFTHLHSHPRTPNDRIRKTFSGVCEAALHTKKHLGTGLVGLQRIHICPVQAIGIQSFTRSNATKREQSQPELFFALQHLYEGGGSFGGTTMRP